MIQLFEGKRKETWSQLSQMMALVHNMWAKNPKGPIDFNPCMVRVPGISSSAVSNAKSAWLKPKGESSVG